jgi:hypothetical protein
MVQDGVEWFGEPSENVVVNVVSPNPVNQSQYIAQAFPAQLNTGETFHVEIRFKNTGNTVWSAGNLYSLGSQNPQDNNTWGINRISLPYDVAPGNEVSFVADLTAPTTPGTYNFQWQMVQDGVEWFGELSENVVVNVVQNPNTPQEIQLIADAKFQTGFNIVDEYGTTIGNIHTSTGNNPAWELAELYSQSSLLNMSPNILPSGFYQWSNNYKDFRVGPLNAEEYDYYIGVNSIEEWNGVYMPVTELERWPAFLIQQRLSAPFLPENHHGPGCPSLSNMSSLVFDMDAKLLYNYTLIQDGYDPNHHVAQFPIYFTVQNLNPNSSGYGQYLWLGILVFDDRYPYFEGHQMIDVHTQALIWTLPDNASRTESLHNGNWVHLHVDLLPYAIQALHDAWDNGIMTASTDISDYKIGGINMGWENPGMNVCTMATRNMSLVAYTNSASYSSYKNEKLPKLDTYLPIPKNIATTDINKVQKNITTKIYPNPATNFINVIADININKIEITDISGKIVKQIFVDKNKNENIEIKNLKNGIY